MSFLTLVRETHTPKLTGLGLRLLTGKSFFATRQSIEEQGPQEYQRPGHQKAEQVKHSGNTEENTFTLDDLMGAPK